MHDSAKTVLHSILRLVAGCFLFSLPALLFWFDVRDGSGVYENGVVETAQVVALGLSGILLAVSALRAERAADELAPALLLVALGVVCMVVRELDAVFDHVLFHGAWKLAAAPFALGAAALAVRRRAVLLDSLAALLRTRIGHTLELFAVSLLVFSRSFGTKILWNSLFADPLLALTEDNLPYVTRAAKNAMEECTELYAYAILLVAAAFALCRNPGSRAREAGNGASAPK